MKQQKLQIKLFAFLCGVAVLILLFCVADYAFAARIADMDETEKTISESQPATKDTKPRKQQQEKDSKTSTEKTKKVIDVVPASPVSPSKQISPDPGTINSDAQTPPVDAQPLPQADAREQKAASPVLEPPLPQQDVVGDSPRPPEQKAADLPPVTKDVPEVKEDAQKTEVVRPEVKTPKPEKSAARPAVKRAPPARAKEKPPEQYVTIDFDDVDIAVFIRFISELTGKNFIIDDKVRGKATIISPRKIPLKDVYKVFLSVLEVNGFATVPVGDMIKIVPAVSAREKSVETRIKKGAGEPDDRIITQIISLERANPDEVKRVLDPIVPRTSSVLSYPPAGMLIITDYLSNVRRLQEIVSALDVEGAGDQISYIPLRNASAAEVVKSLTAIYQQRRPQAASVRIVPDSRTNSVILLASISDTENLRRLIDFMDKDLPRGESNIQVYRLQNSVAEDLAKVLMSIVQEASAVAAPAAPGAPAPRAAAPVVSRNVQVVPDKATNALVIMAEREDYKVLEDII
ncbi:MAG TPA: hypothetical protein ENN23_02540, partial [Deltaproteobacteria bacterium]|nr:hypothetical protein [Deltaproteobacteria bacterium]